MKYRSKLEARYAKAHPRLPYETTKIPYVVTHTYTPDFQVGPNSFVEVKGLFSSADRSKHLYVKKQHPEITIEFVFQNPYLTLNKSSKTTYADWCDKHGFAWRKA